jgi:hypothetical protein
VVAGAGEFVVREDEPGEGLHIIWKGKVISETVQLIMYEVLVINFGNPDFGS